MAHGVDISTVALAWSIAQNGVAFSSVGVENISELEALMYAAELRVTVEQLRSLDRASA
jgi:aryl-alcohol dehydrogenase-like predicted oxidoreductase